VWIGIGPYRADVLAALAKYVVAIAVVDRVAIFLRSRDEPDQMVAVAGVPEDVVGSYMPADAGIPGEVMRHGRPVLVNDYQQLERPLSYAGTEELRGGAGVPIEIAGETLGALSAYSVAPERTFDARDVALLCEAAAVGGLALEHAGMREQVEQQLAATVRAMATAVDMRDQYTAEHSREVVWLANQVGERLGLDEQCARELEYAALLHDVGKIGIPDAVLHKPAQLDSAEWGWIERHPVLGESLLATIPGLARVARIVRSEHERFDGRGYPDGLAGDAIPLESGIILACDAYHAMTSDRPYRRAMTHAEAVEEIRRGAGAQFAPDAAEALLAVLGADQR